MNSRSYALPADAATRAFLEDELGSCFNMDDNVLKLLNMPTDPPWARKVGKVFSEFQQSQEMQFQLSQLPRFDTNDQDDDTHKFPERQKKEEQMYRPLVRLRSSERSLNCYSPMP